MRARVEVKPALLRWAVERSGHGADTFAARFPHLEEWLEGEASPTLTQLEGLAKATYTPIGFFFLPEAPVEQVPIPDFRTTAGPRAPRPSPDLLDTIYICQQRQEWYRDFARSMGEQPLSFVSSTRVTDDVVTAAAKIRDVLGFDLAARRAMSTWTDALRLFIEQADAAGIMVMCSGVVLNNNRRRLDPQEFRGFAMADDLAPVIFINGADSKSAQMFTLAHELAHIWLGQSAVSDAEAGRLPKDEIEKWCNQVAAELLVPLDVLRREYRPANGLESEVARLKPQFKVSSLVLLRRIRDAGGLTWEQLWTEHEREIERLQSIPKKGSGGNFYLTQAARVSKRFARALVVSTWEGRSSFTEAFRLLGVKKMETFRGFERSLGMAV
jgi:Zn-dependent peptidase ImmA (M78 family)